MMLETERLILRPFTVDDFDAFAAFGTRRSDAERMR